MTLSYQFLDCFGILRCVGEMFTIRDYLVEITALDDATGRADIVIYERCN